MTAAVAIAKSFLLAALQFGIAYIILLYLAHFTVIQSVVLAVVGLVTMNAYRLAFKVAERQPLQFEPFWISIQPNWYALSKAFGLADVEKWEELLKKTCANNPPQYSVFRNGFTFTMLSPTLFYSNDHQNFFGELDLRAEVTELTPQQTGGFLEPFSPRFYMKRTLAGEKKVATFEFGLVTHDSLKKSFHPADDKANIPVAYLPEIVFYHYFNAGDNDLPRAHKIEGMIKAGLADFGWAQKERDAEDSWLDWPFELEHKYVKIRYQGIS